MCTWTLGQLPRSSFLMNNQLPAYRPPLVTTAKSVRKKSWFSNSTVELPPNVENTHRLVSQLFGRFLTGCLCLISIVTNLFALANLIRAGFGALFATIGSGFLWFFFYQAYNEPEYLGGYPKISRFYPILNGAVILLVSFICLIGFDIYPLLALLIFETFIIVCFYFMFMGNDFGSSWFLFCKPWRYRKLRPIS